MTLEKAIRILLNEFGTGNEPEAGIVKLVRQLGEQKSVSQVNMDKLLKLGRGLKDLGIK
jgi:hypothetical protein